MAFSDSDHIPLTRRERDEIARRELARRQKLSEYQRGRPKSPEHRRKIGESRRRAFERPGARAAHSERMKAWHAGRKVGA